MLLVDVNRVVPIDDLVERVWGDHRPTRVRETLYSYLSRLRRALSEAERVRLGRHSGGYQLHADPSIVDLHRFRQSVTDAREAGSDERARVALEQALGLWRGEAFATLDTPWLNQLRTTLEAERRATELDYNDAMLRLGRHGDLLADLTVAATDRPHDERLAGQLMLALYRAGRQADALSVYRQIRDLLANQLGVDPGPDLQHLHQQVLLADPGLVGPVPVGAHSPAAHRSIPAQLPAATAWFTGRTAELDRLLAHRGRDRASTAVVISAIDGMAGIGKTALAVHAAHHLAPSFPDGQLFLDLHGFTDGVQPLDPGTALEAMLRAVGVPGAQIPLSVDERAALYRTHLADKRVLIVLDNAHSESQVRPLLPGTAGCLVLITSRRRLAGLDSAETISLEVLPAPDAAALFVDAAGPDRIPNGAGNVVAQIVQLCGRLPLAIRIAAARLRHRPSMTVVELAALLRDAQHRLDELHAGERSATAAFQLSYADLTDDLRRFFRLLGLHPGPDFDRYTAAALTNTTLRDAVTSLDRLLDTHLLVQHAPGRYQFHDLLRAFAARCAARDEPAPERQAAVDRLLEHHLSTAAAAADLLYPFDIGRMPRRQSTSTPAPAFENVDQALAWLGSEHANLIAAASYAAKHTSAHHVVALAVIMRRHLRVRGHSADAHNLHTLALAHVRRTGDRSGEVAALCALGDIRRSQERYGQAAECYQQALATARDLGDPTGELEAVRGLGHIDYMQGRHRQAAGSFALALTIARQAGDRTDEHTALGNLGDVHRALGQYEQAIDCFKDAIAIAREIGHRPGELSTLRSLGFVHNVQGRYGLAVGCFERALDIAREIGNRYGELTVLCGLGVAHRARDRSQVATDCFELALTIARDIGSRNGEIMALYSLGFTYNQQGRHGLATDCFERALAIARAVDDRNGQFEAVHGLANTYYATGKLDQSLTAHREALDLAEALGQHGDQARAHDGLARAERALGNSDGARQHWQSALDILITLGTDQVEDVHIDDIRARLGNLDGQGNTPR